MCGEHSHREAQGGALAVLSAPTSATGLYEPSMFGRLLFQSRGQGDSTTSHVMFTAEPPYDSNTSAPKPCWVKIHQTGDLTRAATTSPCWTTFQLTPTASLPNSPGNGRMEVELGRDMKIEVGGDGIIGRRVSMWTQEGGSTPVAEGIIGYN